MGATSNKNDLEESMIKLYNINTEDFMNNIIAKGKYSEIYKTSNDKNEIYAIKIINKKKILETLNINSNDLENIIQEKLKLMKICEKKSDSTIKIIQFINNKTNYYFVMEYCDSNLREYFQNNKFEKGLDVNAIRDIFNKLNKALVVMNNNNIFHGDLKPEHILISEKDENNIEFKFTDFFNFNSIIKKYSIYTAPEIQNSTKENNSFDIKSDLWSIGLILYELYFGKIPFEMEDIQKMKDKNYKIRLSKADKENNFNDLIEKLLKINVNERISFNDYLNHNFWDKQKNVQITSPSKRSMVGMSSDTDDNNNNNNEDSQGKEVIFKFKTNNLKKELDNFAKNDLKNCEVFKYSGYASKKSDLKDSYIMKWLGKLKFSNLNKMDLSGNGFESIEGLGSLELNLLTELYLNSNKIKNIAELSKVKFENLHLLDLSQNEIISFGDLSNTNLESLSILNLSENKISDISTLGNLSLNNLTILNLGFNDIQSIDIFSSAKFKNLKILFLNNNKINDINVFSQIPFEKLEKLNLNSNNIRDISGLKKSKMKMLKELDLGFNKIEDINAFSSVPFTSLISLNISFNKISKITAFEKIKLKFLKKISLYGNDSLNFDAIIIKSIIDDLRCKNINVM